jgi:hypothetical protein
VSHHDRRDAVVEDAFDIAWIEQVGVGIDVGIPWLQSGGARGAGGVPAGVRRSDDHVTLGRGHAAQSQLKSIGAVTHADHIGHPEETSEIVGPLPTPGPLDVPPRIDNLGSNRRQRVAVELCRA